VQLRQAAREEGMVTLRDAGMRALLAGETTVDEVVKYT
jgi:type II secretory ATPase GspE/PulE/Tfp pilus assembly ATPase PilB-like protein